MDTYYILNLLGLLADIIGVIMLFLTRDTSLSPIQQVNVPAITKGIVHGMDVHMLIAKNINIVIDELNNNIQQTNKTNKKIMRKSLRWLLLIIVGFILQFSASVFQMKSNHHNPTNATAHTETIHNK